MPTATTVADSPTPVTEWNLVPASFDLPNMHRVIRDGDDVNYFGPQVDFDAMSPAQLTEYEAELLLVEAHVIKELDYARGKIARARHALGVAA